MEKFERLDAVAVSGEQKKLPPLYCSRTDGFESCAAGIQCPPKGDLFLKWSKTTSADWLLAHLTFLFYRGGGTDKRYNVHFGSTKMLTILAFVVFHANGNELFTQISSAAETRQCASHKLVTVSNCGKRYEELSSPQDPAKKVSRGSFQFFPPVHRSTEVSTHFLIVFHPISESILVNMLQSENMQCTGKLKHFVYLF